MAVQAAYGGELRPAAGFVRGKDNANRAQRQTRGQCTRHGLPRESPPFAKITIFTEMKKWLLILVMLTAVSRGTCAGRPRFLAPGMDGGKRRLGTVGTYPAGLRVQPPRRPAPLPQAGRRREEGLPHRQDRESQDGRHGRGIMPPADQKRRRRSTSGRYTTRSRTSIRPC